ncbi:EAL domain-containing protein [Chromobacterium sp. IIBBL 290-4]|uniref:EAL domain-containing protein n=1 Tax=Chromobacterium sp. IIBBL 290-4 TaxID=2953890 RepID=UPI0020B69D42|nr:EAL domain-containing protein [Chromobacterium sp. IIBBL 290-4]UTH74717.1 EAL domain-containing protein [Chromobacterium sp. IIBBL 290-4]
MSYHPPSIADIVSCELLSCDPSQSVREAARRMLAAGYSSILVREAGGRVCGFWTEADALELCRSGGDADQPIQQAMKPPPAELAHDLSLQQAVDAFRGRQLRHALVCRNGQPLGMLTLTDIVRNQGLESFLMVKRVADLPVAAAIPLPATATVMEGFSRMCGQSLTALAVKLDDGGYGIVTQRDVLRWLASGKLPATLGQGCRQPLIGVSAGASLLQARRVLRQHNIRHLAVFADDGRLLRILGFDDIVNGIEHEYLNELHEALRQRDEALQQSRHSLLLADKVFESTMEGIVITDPNGVIQSINPAFSRITGYSREEALGQTPAMLKSGKQPPEFYQQMWRSLARDGRWQGEVVNRRKGGLLYTEHLSITAIRDGAGECLHYVAVFSDITQRKQAEERLHFLANHDALTSLPNRTLFLERLQSAVDRAGEERRQLALLFIDLDRFKLVNDTLGHYAGDQLLVHIARQLQSRLKPTDTVARLSGDEFTVLLENVDGEAQAAAAAQDMLDAISELSEVSGQQMFISASIGISLYPLDGEEADTLLVHADTAMYRAKERGKNGFQFYTADMNARALERLKLEYSLHRALAQGELELWYQPKVALDSGEMIGAEALLRWRHPELGLVSPDRFIPIAEESALIGQIGAWVLRTACADIRDWQRRGLKPGRVAINVSGRQLKHGDFVEQLRQALADYGLGSECLELEITESVVMEEGGAMIEMLRRLQELGLYLSIDDFGTGYSSLSYLKRLPVRGLKIDRSFIADLHHDSDDAAITRAIVSIAHSLGLDVVAEGVEEEAQRLFLLEQGCYCAQGYLFSKPLPRETFECLLVQPRRKMPLSPL